MAMECVSHRVDLRCGGWTEHAGQKSAALVRNANGHTPPLHSIVISKTYSNHIGVDVGDCNFGKR